MKIISSAGFGFTGSTAITDLISEYKTVHSCEPTGYELKFFFDTQGIFHLQNNLLYGNVTPTRTAAVNDYYRICQKWATSGTKMNYEKFFDGHFIEYTKEYLQRLGGLDYITYHDFSDLKEWQWYIFRILNKANSLVNSIVKKKKYGEYHVKSIPIFSKKGQFRLYNVTEKEFVEITKEYFNKLFSAFDNKSFVNIHQLIPIEMIDDCTKFFDDICLIATDRDPRDVFLTGRYKYAMDGHPSKDVHFFCKHYRMLRDLKKEVKNSSVLNIQFEDLVFHYDETVKRIEEYIGLNPKDHTKYKTRFIPELAMKNCNLKNQYPEEKENIEYIEHELKEWLYDFCEN